jgi:accessory gene regulator B
MQRYNPSISDSQARIAKFGLECLFNETSKFLIYLIIFSLLSKTELFLLATASFWSFRAVAGGYHDETYFRCLITSFIVMTIIIFPSTLMPWSFELRVVLLIVALILSAIFAPVDHPNKPIISPIRRRNFKFLAISFVIIWGIISFFLNTQLSSTIVNSILIATIMLPAGLIANKIRLRKNL